MARRRGQQDQVEWRFFTPPVAFAFSLGVALSALITRDENTALIVFYVALFGVAFTAAHMIAHSWRRRSFRRRNLTAEEEERERRALAARAAREAAQPMSETDIRRRRRRRR